MQRVILVSHGFQPNYEAGFANGLARNGVAVTLIGSDRSHVALLDKRVAFVNLRGSQQENRSAIAKAVNLIRYHVRLVYYVARIPDAVVHVIGIFGYPIAMGIVENCVFRILGRRLILTVHNLMPHNRRNRLNRLLYRTIYRIPTCLVCHTKRTREDLMGVMGVGLARSVLMEHGIESLPPIGRGDRAEARQWLKLCETDVLLLFFGAVSHYKGVDTLIQCMAELPDNFHLVVAGQHPPREAAYREQIIHLMTTSIASERIRHIDSYVSEHDLHRLFCAADRVVMPYRAIDQSGVLFLAMSYGVPLIAFDVGSFGSYIVGDLGEVVPANDRAALVNAMRRAKCGFDAGRHERIRIVASRFLWSETVKSMLHVYA